MSNMERLLRVETLLEQVKEYPILANDKTFDRIGHHLSILDEDYSKETSSENVPQEEIDLVNKIIKQYNILSQEINQQQIDLTKEKNIHKKQSTLIQNGYFQKSIQMKSKYISNYK